MTDTGDSRSVLDQIESALEATCGALMSLEVIAILKAVPDAENVQAHVAKAMSCLREAIAELRDAQQYSANGLALGFVLGRERCAQSGNAGPGQSRSRRAE